MSRKYNKSLAYGMIKQWSRKGGKKAAVEQFNEILNFSHRHEVGLKLGTLMTGRTWRIR